MSKSKKVILFIVEGPSEETAFGSIFNKIFSSDVVTFEIIHGDMTTRYETYDDPREAVRQKVISYIEMYKVFNWSDIKRIIQISDTDGAFIPDEYVIEATGNICYKDNCILTSDSDYIKKRNKIKKTVMNRLASYSYLTYEGKRVPYNIFYLSRNLEHALYRIEDDLTDEQKKDQAHQFRIKYKNNTKSFKKLLLDDGLLVPGSYKETWQYINDGFNSLNRGSNLGLIFDICKVS